MSTISSMHQLNFIKGNVHCAEDSHDRHMGDTLVPSVAPPPLRRLDQTRHHLTYAGDTDRPCQKQIRTRGRKRLVASAIDHPAAPGEAACLYQDGSDAPGPAVNNGTNLETSPRHCPARDAAALAPPGLQALLEIQVEGSFSQAKTIPGDYLLDSGDGQEQSTLGSRTDSW